LAERPTAGGEPTVPLYRRIQDHVRQGMATGRFRPGQRLPSESELALMFDTTRATVARAFEQLTFDRLVVRRPGSGTYVAEITEPLVAMSSSAPGPEISAEWGDATCRVLSFATVALPQRSASSLDAGTESRAFRLERLQRNSQPLSLETVHISYRAGIQIPRHHLTQDRLQDILARLKPSATRQEGVVRASLASARVCCLMELARGSAVLIRDYRIADRDGRIMAQGEIVYGSVQRLHYEIHGS
jgi:GntR family transcriptional regulator